LGLLKTTSTIAFQQVTPPSSTHFRTPDSVIPRAELARVKMERDILKKATAYFAKESM